MSKVSSPLSTFISPISTDAFSELGTTFPEEVDFRESRVCLLVRV